VRARLPGVVLRLRKLVPPRVESLCWLGGEALSYADPFERCHGAPVELVPDEQFERAHSLPHRALPGHGAVAAWYRGWRETQLVPRERVQHLAEAALRAGRRWPALRRDSRWRS